MDAPQIQTTVPTDPQALAEAVGQTMYAADAATQALGMTVVEIAPGMPA
ncbi:putative phenylacetic acid degradation protein [Bordetella holmesii 41130]|nr:putative phenylacetic acid degradation protein [Bordetella holmesii 41130]